MWWTFTYGSFCARIRYLGSGKVITSHSILWDLIILPCPRYLLLVRHISERCRSTSKSPQSESFFFDLLLNYFQLVTRNDKTVSYDYNSNMGVTLNVAESCSGDCYVQTCHVDSGGNHIGRGCDCWKCEGTDRLVSENVLFINL